MRSSKSRSRSKSNRNRPSGGNVINRVFDSSGPEGKVRGTPQQIIDKYNQLARDAQLSNDRVAAENFQQHAEHYLRLLGEAQREQDARREEQERQNRERQQERDRERQDRQQDRDTQPSQAPTTQPQPLEQPQAQPQPDTVVADLSQAPQPDVLDLSAPVSDDDTGLVETPESQPKKPARKPRARKPKAAAAEKPAEPKKAPVDDSSDDAPKAAE